jgi:hypothetical protein
MSQKILAIVLGKKDGWLSKLMKATKAPIL